MKNYLLFFYIMVAVVALACSSTKITSTWREPNKEVTIGALNIVLVVALLKDETSRRKAEDERAGYLKGKGVVSYNYLDKNIRAKNEDEIRTKLS
jgi:hypothetical protein